MNKHWLSDVVGGAPLLGPRLAGVRVTGSF